MYMYNIRRLALIVSTSTLHCYHNSPYAIRGCAACTLSFELTELLLSEK